MHPALGAGGRRFESCYLDNKCISNYPPTRTLLINTWGITLPIKFEKEVQKL